jgi:hypothetical protein
MGSSVRGRSSRWLVVTLGIAVALLVIIRVVLDPLTTHYARRALAGGEGFRGALSRVHVTIVPPAVRVERLKIIEWPRGKWEDPLYYLESLRVSILWREILHGHLVGDVVVNRPKLRLKAHHEVESGKKASSISEQLHDLSPLRVDRLEVDDGEVLVAEGADEAAQLWIHAADLVAENLATRKALMEGEFSRIHGSAWVQRSGKLSFAVTMDPFAKALTFSGRAALRDLDLRELYAFTADRSDLRATQGRIDLFVDVRARKGELTGGVKPVLRDVQVASVRKDLGDRIKAALTDAAIQLVSSNEGGERKVATVIPLRGQVSDVRMQGVPTILGVIRNAFVEGLADGFSNLPPPTAEKKEGVIKQTVKALKKSEGPPEAQPEPRHGRRGKPEKAATETTVGSP